MPCRMEIHQQRVKMAAEDFRQGLSLDQSAERIGVARQTISFLRRRARDLGLLEPKRLQNSTILQGVKLGEMRAALEALPPEAARWLASQIPEGVTAAEFAVACILDAYHDEQETKG